MDDKPLVPAQTLDIITAKIVILKRQTASSIIEIGQWLIQAKEMVGHGNWLRYLEERVDFSSKSATRFMRAAEQFANSPALANLDPSKVYLLLEAPDEDQAALAEQAESLTSRELEAKIREINSAKRQNEALAQRLAVAEAKLAEPTTAPEPVVIHQTPPQVLAEMAELRSSLKRSETQAAELLAQSQGTAEAKRALEAERAKVDAMQKRLHRLSTQFDDEGRDQYGGSKLMDAMDPLFLPIPKTLAEVRVLKRVGVGGPCDEDRLSALIPQIRELADSLTEILKDRATRSINVTPTEVE